MAIYFPEMEDIYFEKTKAYFQEVVSSYSNGNYRSAIVMLYSVAICDMLFKLQELKDMFNDSVADEILEDVDKSRNEHDNKSKSRWEKEFVDNVYKRTKLLDLEAYTNLNHLYDYRNFSAHPALNENYELIAPSKETTIACIKNTLKDILVKPPIFIKNIVDTLTEDLKEKKDIYENENDKLKIYLNNKYFSKMPSSMKIATIKAFWKFCFCLPANEDCLNNLTINRKALSILISSFEKETISYIKENKQFFSVSANDKCLLNLVVLLSQHPFIYDELNSDSQLQIDALLDRDLQANAVAWFKYKNASSHLSFLRENPNLSIGPKTTNCMITYYSEIGETAALIDFFIWYYGNSHCYDAADIRFERTILPFLEKMSFSQFEELIKNTNTNRQIWDRGLARNANNKIMHYAKKVLGENFDYSKYEHFNYDTEFSDCEAQVNIQTDSADNTDWPF